RQRRLEDIVGVPRGHPRRRRQRLLHVRARRVDVAGHDVDLGAGEERLPDGELSAGLLALFGSALEEVAGALDVAAVEGDERPRPERDAEPPAGAMLLEELQRRAELALGAVEVAGEEVALPEPGVELDEAPHAVKVLAQRRRGLEEPGDPRLLAALLG